MNLSSRIFVFYHGRQIASFEVCDLTSVTCDVTFFAKSLRVAVRVDKNVACLTWLNTVFDTYFSFTFFSKTLNPLVAKNGSKKVNNMIVKLPYMPLPWQH